jgi:peptidoglycan/xylan/chitin deacetylase (PgdA/CDA1 family)
MNKSIIFYLLLFDVILITGLFLYFGFPWYWVILPFLTFFLITAIFVSNIGLNIFVPSIHKGNPRNSSIALTFDDGPHPVYTPIVLDLLKKYNAKATFFLIGKNIQAYPYLVERILAEKHTIGNHSFSHSNGIGFKGKSGWEKEIAETNSVIQKLTGKTPKFFRPPFGITTPHLAAALKQSKIVSIGWSHRTFDTAIKNVDKIEESLLKHINLGSIILLHDSHERIQPLLEQLLPKLAAQNLKFVTVNDLINEEPYVEL